MAPPHVKVRMVPEGPLKVARQFTGGHHPKEQPPERTTACQGGRMRPPWHDHYYSLRQFDQGRSRQLTTFVSEPWYRPAIE